MDVILIGLIFAAILAGIFCVNYAKKHRGMVVDHVSTDNSSTFRSFRSSAKDQDDLREMPSETLNSLREALSRIEQEFERLETADGNRALEGWADALYTMRVLVEVEMYKRKYKEDRDKEEKKASERI